MKLLIALLTAGALAIGCTKKSEPAKTTTPVTNTTPDKKVEETKTEEAPKVAKNDSVTLIVDGMT